MPSMRLNLFPRVETTSTLIAFDSLGVYSTAVLDTGEIPNGSSVYTPSIAITPGDYWNIVGKRKEWFIIKQPFIR